MRIAYAGTLPPHPGGSAILGYDLLAGLARRRHDVTAIAPITAAALEQGEPLADAEFELTRYLVPSFESSPNHPASDDFRACERHGVERLLAPLLEAGRTDLVIAGRETFASHIPALARRFAVSCIVLAQGGTTWGLLSGAYPRDLERRVLDGLSSADRVIAVARHLAARLRELELPGAGVIVAHVSNLKDIKRPLDVAHSAIAALRRDQRLWFLIVGDGPGSALIEAECARAGIRERFRFTGWVPRAAVPRYLRLADIVVMPSEVEALALAYLETQACGRVLVASDIAAAHEVVQDGATGLLFGKGDIVAMTECILRAAADAPLRESIGARARAFAETYTFEAALDAYERVFADVRR